MKKKFSAYTWVAFLTVIIFVLVGLVAWQYHCAVQERDQYAALVNEYDDLTVKMDQMMDALSGKPGKLSSIIKIASVQGDANEVSLSFQDAVTSMQNQYDAHINHVNFLLATIAILVTVISLAFPIFSYTFVQKDQIERIKNEGDRLEEENRKLLDELIETKENIKNEQSELNQMIGEAKEDLSKISEKMRAEMLRLEGLIRQGNQLNQVAAESRKGKITQIDPISESGEDRAQAYSLEAFVNMRNRRYEEALRAVEKAIELDSDNAGYHYLLGAALHRLKRQEEALRAVEKSIELDPDSAEYYYSLSITLHKLKRYEEALTAIEKAIELDPDNAKFMETKGALEFRLEKYPEALSIINEVLKKDPTTAYAYRCRAMIYAEMRKNHLFDCDDNMIEEDFSKSLSLDENSAYTSNELARFYLSIGEKDKALEQIKRAHDFDPLEPEVYHTYELYYQAIGDEEQEKYYHMLAEKHGYIPDL
jgi:Flp pilus assembly protein TadD, contains TPR repeats